MDPKPDCLSDLGNSGATLRESTYKVDYNGRVAISTGEGSHDAEGIKSRDISIEGVSGNALNDGPGGPPEARCGLSVQSCSLFKMTHLFATEV